ncbi:hypothetical protein CCP3SC1_690016 [Gammaproteobacteria bacterium]
MEHASGQKTPATLNQPISAGAATPYEEISSCTRSKKVLP